MVFYKKRFQKYSLTENYLNWNSLTTVNTKQVFEMKSFEMKYTVNLFF